MNKQPDPLIVVVSHLRNWWRELCELEFKPKRVFVGLSGGIDSSAMLMAMVQLRDELGGVELRAIHVNHALQQAADEFEQSAIRLCQTVDVSLVCSRPTIELPDHRGLEAAARSARYASFASVLHAGDIVLTAHHRRDQAESVLLQLFRGAGPAGLSGIAPLRVLGAGWLARPLLELCDSYLIETAKAHSLQTIEDPSNSDTYFARNYLRKELWPQIEARWPGVEQTISRAATHQRGAALATREVAAQLLLSLGADMTDKSGQVLSLAKFCALARWQKRIVIREWLSQFGVAESQQRSIDELVRQLCAAGSSSAPKADFGAAKIVRYQNLLYLMRRQDEADGVRRRSSAAPVEAIDSDSDDIKLDWPLASATALKGGELRFRASGAVVERASADPGNTRCVRLGVRDALQAGLRVRTRKGGERIRLAGSSFSQSIKKLFQDRAIPPWERGLLPFIYVEDELIAVPGVGVSEGWAPEEQEAFISVEFELNIYIPIGAPIEPLRWLE